MGRPIYPYELGDPDFSWLMSNFQENYPNYSYSESTNLPVVFIKTSDEQDYEFPVNIPEDLEEEDSELFK